MSCGTCGIQASETMQGDTGVPAGPPTTAGQGRCPWCQAFVAAQGAPCANPRCPGNQGTPAATDQPFDQRSLEAAAECLTVAARYHLPVGGVYQGRPFTGGQVQYQRASTVGRGMEVLIQLDPPCYGAPDNPPRDHLLVDAAMLADGSVRMWFEHGRGVPALAPLHLGYLQRVQTVPPAFQLDPPTALISPWVRSLLGQRTWRMDYLFQRHAPRQNETLSATGRTCQFCGRRCFDQIAEMVDTADTTRRVQLCRDCAPTLVPGQSWADLCAQRLAVAPTHPAASAATAVAAAPPGASWRKEHAALGEFLDAACAADPDNEFFRSLRDRLHTRGDLSPKQQAALEQQAAGGLAALQQRQAARATNWAWAEALVYTVEGLSLGRDPRVPILHDLYARQQDRPGGLLSDGQRRVIQHVLRSRRKVLAALAAPEGREGLARRPTSRLLPLVLVCAEAPDLASGPPLEETARLLRLGWTVQKCAQAHTWAEPVVLREEGSLAPRLVDGRRAAGYVQQVYRAGTADWQVRLLPADAGPPLTCSLTGVRVDLLPNEWSDGDAVEAAAAAEIISGG